MRKAVFVLLFILLGWVSGYVSYKAFFLARKVEVPELKGRSLQEAKLALLEKGLRLALEGKDFDPQVPEGYICGQSPEAGKMMKTRGQVKAVLSKGPATLRMPSVLGMPLAEAAIKLEKRGLAISRLIKVHSEDVPVGLVIAQEPAPDEKTGRPVSAVVSAGPHDVIYYVPDFRTLTGEEAGALAGQMGLDGVFEGSGEKVIAQRPKPGSSIKPGQKIHIRLGNE